MNHVPGVFVAFEGIDGSGKTTIVDLVARSLRSNGIATRTTARTDPGEQVVLLASHHLCLTTAHFV